MFAFLQMAIVAIMASNLEKGLSSSSVGFALSYVAFRSILIFQYLNAGYHISIARSLTTWYSIGFGSSVMLWLTSVFVPMPWRLVLWILGLIVDFATPLTAGKIVARIPPSLPHITERIGLFTIIVLGETVVAVARSISDRELNFSSVILVAFACAIQIVFDLVNTNKQQPITNN